MTIRRRSPSLRIIPRPKRPSDEVRVQSAAGRSLGSLRGIGIGHKDIMSVKEVAGCLLCSIAQVINIPRAALPRYRGPAGVNLYLREDVVQYVRNCPANSEGRHA